MKGFCCELQNPELQMKESFELSLPLWQPPQTVLNNRLNRMILLISKKRAPKIPNPPPKKKKKIKQQKDSNSTSKPNKNELPKQKLNQLTSLPAGSPQHRLPRRRHSPRRVGVPGSPGAANGNPSGALGQTKASFVGHSHGSCLRAWLKLLKHETIKNSIMLKTETKSCWPSACKSTKC